MARSVPDAALMLSGMAGSDACDVLAGPLDPAAFAEVEAVDLSSLRVAVSEDLGFAPIDDRIRATFRERVEMFGSAFGQCVERSPNLETANEVFRSEEHTSELQSLMRISYAVFCLKKKKQTSNNHTLQPHSNTNHHHTQ